MLNPLDLYAKIENLIGFDEQYEKLYQQYLELLSSLKVKKILDVGCGNGRFLAHLQKANFTAEGIDRSEAMVKRARELGVAASEAELSSFSPSSFDCVVAIADVLNYISTHDIDDFVDDFARLICKDGYFLCDINTLYGFQEVADGTMCQDNGDKFLSVEAVFENNELLTKIVLFEKDGDLFKKEEGKITQYYHPLSYFKKLKQFKLLTTKPVTLFGNEPDKRILIFQKL